MCQVSSGELGFADPCVDLCFDFVECALERGIDGAETRKYGGEARAQEAVVEASKRTGCAEAELFEEQAAMHWPVEHLRQ